MTCRPVCLPTRKGDDLTLSADLGGGTPLPSWVQFDAGGGKFTFTPQDGDDGKTDIYVYASDGVNTASIDFSVTVDDVLKRHIILAAACFGFTGSPAGAVDVAALLAADRAVMAAEHAYCAAAYGVDVQRAGYLPSVDVSLSASDKTVDKTTRADAFGGEGSPEYDGHGLDAELTVSQTLYDWGKTGADVGIAKAQRRKQELAYTLAMQDSLAELVSGTLQYEAQSKAVAALRRNVQRLTVNRKAVAEQVRLGYKNRRKLNDYDLLLLDRKTLLAEARQKRRETGAKA